MKKIISILAFMIVLVCGMTAAYAENTTVQVGNSEIYINEQNEVTVPVSISGNPGFGAFTIDVKYDNTYLTPKSVTASTDLNGLFYPNPAYKENVIRMVFAGAQNIVGDVRIADITFTVSENALGVYPVEMMCDMLSNCQYEDLPYENVNGSITVQSAEMVDTTDVEGPNPSITSVMATINTNGEFTDTVTWHIGYGGTSKDYVQKYDTTFSGNIKLGLYIEDLYVEDTSLLNVKLDIGDVTK